MAEEARKKDELMGGNVYACMAYTPITEDLCHWYIPVAYYH